MSNVFEFVAESRVLSGKVGAKGLRRNGSIPAVIYGAGKEPSMIALPHNHVLKHLGHEAVYSHVLDINVDGNIEKAILKDVQHHPSKAQILHLDFQRVSETEKIRVHVPLHFINEGASVGVKKGGIVTHNLVDIEITCLPSVLPEFIEVDLLQIDLGGSVHLTDLVLPEGSEIVALLQGDDHDLTVVSVSAPKGGSEETETEADADEAE